MRVLDCETTRKFKLTKSSEYKQIFSTVLRESKSYIKDCVNDYTPYVRLRTDLSSILAFNFPSSRGANVIKCGGQTRQTTTREDCTCHVHEDGFVTCHTCDNCRYHIVLEN